MTIGEAPGDEFVCLKELVETLRSSLPPLDQRQHDLVGIYLLAALRLGAKDATYLRVIDEYFGAQEKPRLQLVKSKDAP